MNDASLFIQGLSLRPSASDDAIAECEDVLNTRLPQDYIAFVKVSNGVEGFMGSNAYLVLWRVEELASMNLSYEVARNAVGLLLFGSDGGGEAYGFDTRVQPNPVVRVPFVGMSWGLAQPMGETFRTFLERLRRNE